MRFYRPKNTKLLSGTALASIAVFALGISQAYATCDINAPANGQTVNCVVAGGADTTGVINAAATDVTINIDPNAQIDANASQGVSIGSGTIQMSVGSLLRSTIQEAVKFSAGGSAIIDVVGTVIGTGVATAIDFGTTDAALFLADTGSITGNVIAAAGGSDELYLSGTATGTFNTDDIGAGQQFQGFDSFNKKDSGAWTLTGTNTQDWRIYAGILEGTANNLGNVNNAGTLRISTGGTYTGNIIGTGNFFKTGVTNLTLSGTNTYSGGTTIFTGTLTGTTTSLQGNILNNAALAFDDAANGTYAGVVSGTGTFTKLGAGTTTLSNTSTYSGTTTVTAGTLSVNGSIANSNTTVGAAGTLKGTGTLGNTVINGTFAPGNSIGTINVSGTLTYNIGSSYQVEVNDAGNADKTIATGAITINGGDVDVQAIAGSYQPTTLYTILQGASVTGTFDTVTSNLAFLDPTLIYNAANVQLQMDRNDIDFESTAADSTQAGVARAINGLGAGNDLYDVITNLSAAASQQAYDALSGENVPGTLSQTAQSANQIGTLLANRMHSVATAKASMPAPAPNDPGLYVAALIEPAAGDITSNKRLWATAIGSFGHTAAKGTASAQDNSSAGFLFGADAPLNDNGTYIGGFAGWDTGETQSDALHASSDIQNYYVGAYSTIPLKAVRLSAGLSGTYHDIDTVRYIVFPGWNRRADGNTNGFSASTFVEAALPQKKITPSTKVEPYAQASLTFTRLKAYTETGAGTANLAVDDADALTPSTTLGVRAEQEIKDLTLRASFGWQHSYGNLDDKTTMRFASGTTNFDVQGPGRARDTAVIGVGISGQLKSGVTAYADYNGALAKDTQQHAFSAGAKLDF